MTVAPYSSSNPIWIIFNLKNSSSIIEYIMLISLPSQSINGHVLIMDLRWSSIHMVHMMMSDMMVMVDYEPILTSLETIKILHSVLMINQ